MSLIRLQQRPNVSVLKWLILLALAWSQLAFADHQTHHDLHADEHCSICVQHDRDDSVPAELDLSPAHSSSVPEISVEGADPGTQPLSIYSARAPPSNS